MARLSGKVATPSPIDQEKLPRAAELSPAIRSNAAGDG